MAPDLQPKGQGFAEYVFVRDGPGPFMGAEMRGRKFARRTRRMTQKGRDGGGDG